LILEDTITVLEADGDVNGLISGRIFTDVAPDNATTPYIVQTLLIEQRQSVLEGGKASVKPARIQLDCWSDSLSEAVDLASKVETALYGASQFTVGDYSIESDYDADSELRRIIVDVSLWS
jgi:hypothetical protein